MPRLHRTPLALDPTFGSPLARGGWRLLRPLAERAIGLPALNELYLAADAEQAREFCSAVLARLGVTVSISAEERERIPAEGSVVVVANHPYGGIEGLILGQLLTARRPDVKILANYLLEQIEPLRELFYFVDPFGGARAVRGNLRTLRESLRWLREGGALATFPAGEVSHLNLRRRRIEDPLWLDTVESLVRRQRCQVLPVYFTGANGPLFQALGCLHPRLRTLRLGRELLNRRNTTIEVRIGTPIPWRQLAGHSAPGATMAYLRSRTYILGERKPLEHSEVQPRRTPKSSAPIVPPVPVELLEAELRGLSSDRLLVESGDDLVYVARADEIPRMLREIGRQREISFRAVGEGTGREIDLDRFDEHYLHLFAWSRKSRELIGAYRLGLTDELLAAGGIERLYTASLFAYKAKLFESMGPALEMGRSFISLAHQKSYTGLLLLWKGIGRFVVRHPRYATLFGPVSISADYDSASQRLMVAFLNQNRFVHPWAGWVRPRTPRKSDRAGSYPLRPADLQDLDEVSAFISEIESDHKGVPILLKQYLKLGGRLLGFNVDPEFSDVLDVLIVVDLRETAKKILARYMGAEGAESFLARAAEAGESSEDRSSVAS